MAKNSIWVAAAIVCTTVACGEDERVLPPIVDASADQSTGGGSGTGGAGATGGVGGSAGEGGVHTRTTTTRGSAIALTSDGKRAVALNRVGGFASIIDVDWASKSLGLPKNIDLNRGLSPGSEPWAVVTDETTDAAYVVLRRDKKLVRIRNLSTTPVYDPTVDTVDTGSEPTGIAISPNGTYLYVANWGEGTIDVYATATLSRQTPPINLNTVLAATASLGNVTRPGLAHPRSVVVTNDGDTDDDDETLYITEFFSQQIPGFKPSGPRDFDVARQGYVYVIAPSAPATAIPIAPVVDTGFRDSNGCPTSCFPNQLFSATLDNGRLYVTGVCTSPVGPIGALAPVDAGSDCVPESDASNPANFRTLFQSAVFVIDTATGKELPKPALLPKEFDDFYKQKLDVDDAGAPLPGKLAPIPLAPVDLAFAPPGTHDASPDTHDAFVVASGSDSVFRVSYATDGTTHTVGSDVEHFINLYKGGLIPEGRGPTGIAVAANGAFAVIVDETTDNVSLADLDAAAPQIVAATIGALNRGRWAFATGRERWSYQGRSWGSCDSCHVDGWSDGVTWFFSRGPRQTPSLDASYLTRSPDPIQRRIMNWTGVFDEVHDLDVIARGVLGAVGAIVWEDGIQPGDRITYDGTPTGIRRTLTKHNGLNGSSAALMPNAPAVACQPDAGPCNSIVADWNAIDTFIQSLRSPSPPTALNEADKTAGRQLFQSAGCPSCHGGPGWTISARFYTPNELNNNGVDGGSALLRATLYTSPTGFRRELNPPLLDYDGSAPLRYVGDAGTANDQINCVLRDVGTWGMSGIAPDGGAPVLERRQDMTAVSQGRTGFNPPSLLGLAAGAPYFHAGNARTLEEVFDDTFARHHQAMAGTFLSDPATRTTEINELVAFLLSIDRLTPTFPVPNEADLCASIPVDSGIK